MCSSDLQPGLSGDGVTCKKPAGPGFAEVYSTIFQGKNCTGCHGQFGSQSAAYTWLTTQSLCGGKAVVPGDVANSTIVNKTVSGVTLSGCGGKMPKGSAGLSGSDADLLKNWISGGAQP